MPGPIRMSAASVDRCVQPSASSPDSKPSKNGKASPGDSSSNTSSVASAGAATSPVAVARSDNSTVSSPSASASSYTGMATVRRHSPGANVKVSSSTA